LRGSLFSLPPGEAKWQRIDTGLQQSIFGGTILADGHVALVGGNGLIVLLDPATHALQRLHSGTGSTLSGIAETKDRQLIVVGDDGVHSIDPKTAELTQ
jgi:photosystem II stability/assembly factor-like uncharacterized protein